MNQLKERYDNQVTPDKATEPKEVVEDTPPIVVQPQEGDEVLTNEEEQAIEKMGHMMQGQEMEGEGNERDKFQMMVKQEKEANEKINQLEGQVAKLVGEGKEREKLVNHWRDKAKRLSVRCLTLEEDLAKKDDIIVELQEFNRIQGERIKSLEEDRRPPPPRPSMAKQGTRRFSTRAMMDPSFAETLGELPPTNHSLGS